VTRDKHFGEAAFQDTGTADCGKARSRQKAITPGQHFTWGSISVQ